MERRCSTCGETKPLDLFSPDASGRRDTHQRQCKACRAAYMRGYNAANRERIAKKVALAKWGLTEEQFDALYDGQDHRCAICGRRETVRRGGNPKRLPIDHDHLTGEVRGLLCQNCNQGLGNFGDDAALLEAAIAYLKDPPARKHGYTLPADSFEMRRARERDARRAARHDGEGE